jgi:hypothetical protein
VADLLFMPEILDAIAVGPTQVCRYVRPAVVGNGDIPFQMKSDVKPQSFMS